MRPKRKVTHDGVFYRVEGWNGTFADEQLAQDVGRELDRVDPLPCPHDCSEAEVTRLSSPEREFMCVDCGAIVRREAR